MIFFDAERAALTPLEMPGSLAQTERRRVSCDLEISAKKLSKNLSSLELQV
jgi:hypothetical protein